MRCEYILFPDCIPVKGYSRSIIYDLSRHNYVFIPNILYDILNKYHGFPYAYLKHIYRDDIIVLEEYKDLLLKYELVYYTPNTEPFIPIEISHKTFSLIDNIIIDNEDKHHNYVKIATEVEELGCSSMILRFYNYYPINRLESIVSIFRNSILKDIAILLQYCALYPEDDLKHLINYENRVSKIIIVSSPKKKKIFHKGSYICYEKYNFKNENYCGRICNNCFAVNINMFIESQLFNNCLYKKISIDKYGEVKNCPSFLTSFGNYSDISFSDVILNEKFKQLWYIKKDDIKECSICEYRYMCQDCRAYLHDSKNLYSKPLKCNYNPYKYKWKK